MRARLIAATPISPFLRGGTFHILRPIGQMQSQEEPIAFGLKAVLIMAMYEVQGSDFDAIAEKMSAIPGVQSAEVAKMDLALG